MIEKKEEFKQFNDVHICLSSTISSCIQLLDKIENRMTILLYNTETPEVKILRELYVKTLDTINNLLDKAKQI